MTKTAEQKAAEKVEAKAKTAEQKAAEKVKARVLAGCEYGKPNDVVEVTAAELEANAGVLDGNPAAVEYAESLKK